ncbi:MAG: FliI/YscN family ATPase [Planctomycetes bacterium]|nr:FliI/YscN family ATPase [Planctomycetota bacterium]MCB9905054.1 FliI/YscN family ATPase [Planctomycetota bacterium]
MQSARVQEHLRKGGQAVFHGRVDIVSGVLVEAIGVPAALGEMCRIHRGSQGHVDAEVVGFRNGSTLLMPHGDLDGVAPRQLVTSLGRSFSVPCTDQLLGRVVDGYGRPIDGGLEITSRNQRAVRQPAPGPLSRTPIDEPLQTGVRVIDGLMTVGRGQRMGIFAGSGVGKSSLLGQITRGTDADVVVCCLVGERGREVQDFVHEVLGREGSSRAVMVVATSDRAPIERYLAPFVAVTIAEHFRDQGKNVLLLMDSVTRFAGACREIGLAAGEPPTVRGYPPSFFATVPKLVERMGRANGGSITGLLTVLLDGDDPNEPVADTLRGLLDGHVFLSREMASSGHFPAVDVLHSLSRLMSTLASSEHQARALSVRESLSAWRDGRDLVEIGAYKPGSNAKLDRAIQRMPIIETFLKQTPTELNAFDETLELLGLVTGDALTGGTA